MPALKMAGVGVARTLRTNWSPLRSLSLAVVGTIDAQIDQLHVDPVIGGFGRPQRGAQLGVPSVADAGGFGSLPGGLGAADRVGPWDRRRWDRHVGLLVMRQLSCNFS